MFKHFCRIGWRNIIRHPFYAMVSIAGLSVGIAFTLVIMAFVWNEWQVNSQLKNSTRQYIIQSKWKDANQGFELATFGPLAKALRENYPGLVANYYRFDGVTTIVSRQDKSFREKLQIGDSTLLSMYGFQLLHGDEATALHDPFSVVITTEIAQKYFGKTAVVGETITIENFAGSKHDFIVKGVLNKYGRNTVTRLTDDGNNQVFLPLTALPFFGRNMDWNNPFIVGMVELQPGIQPAQLLQPMAHLLKQNVSPQLAQGVTPYLTTLNNFYFSFNNGLIKKMLYALSGIACFILLMAIINFINMSVSRSSARMREIGVRKVLGSLKGQLTIQFLAESILLVSLSTILALFLYALTADLFTHILGKELPALHEFPLYFIGVMLVLILFVGLLAGVYPAFRLSSLPSVDSLKGKLQSVKENSWFRRSLVAFQFATAIIVFSGATIIARQVNYFFSRELGYNKDYVVSAQLPRNWSPEGVRRMETVRRDFTALPQVANATLSYEIPDGANIGNITFHKPDANAAASISSLVLTTDEYYAGAYNIPVVAGEFYSLPGNYTDSTKIVINETLALALGWSDAKQAVGKQAALQDGGGFAYTIAGVVKDYHFGSMQTAISPMAFLHVTTTNRYRYMSFRLRPGNMADVLAALQKQWAAAMPGAPFEYKFMDETLQFVYRSEIQLKQASYTATVLAIIIVLLGILGLVSLSIQKRTKEIGIRKVLGSSIQNIIMLFLKDFAPLMLIAALVACPVAWLLMKQWLSDYAYRVDITAAPFTLAIVALACLTGALILIQTIKAALVNPVKSLRTE
ncbi:ABC transporter permease [Paraflavitalea soli]|uniref:ABC transporter permease n=1 Tax=Paraflavitalea soli TaxID=2315862 RepID=A0A3B7MRD9_9BACT|nr:ABC transporter permease [Paraflavitalea soli]AXY75913.1 ABC transporter permease [Paraflavitalea soli]